MQKENKRRVVFVNTPPLSSSSESSLLLSSLLLLNNSNNNNNNKENINTPLYTRWKQTGEFPISNSTPNLTLELELELEKEEKLKLESQENKNQKQKQLIEEIQNKNSNKTQCVFRESWQNTHRCVHCNEVRAQHLLFSPTRQERFNKGIIFRKEISEKHWWSSSNNNNNNNNNNNSEISPLPYYYANPQQWEPPQDKKNKRNILFYNSLNICNNFFPIWGKSTLCMYCGKAKEHHVQREVIPITPYRKMCKNISTSSPRNNIKNNNSSSSNNSDYHCSHHETCSKFIPLWNNNKYCSDCYMLREYHSLEARQPSPLIRTSSLSSVLLLSSKYNNSSVKKRETSDNIKDWLSTDVNNNNNNNIRDVSIEQKKKQNNKILRHRDMNTSNHRKVIMKNNQHEEKNEIDLDNTIITSTKTNNNNIISKAVAAATGVSSSISSSVLLTTPKRVLTFSAPPSTFNITSSTTTRPVTPSDYNFSQNNNNNIINNRNNNNNNNVFPREFPWSFVLQYSTLEELLIFKNICKSIFNIAIPLIHLNCRYILNTFDIPFTKRETLSRCSDLYASLIKDILRQIKKNKKLSYGPIKAASNPIRFLHYCILKLFNSIQAIGSKKKFGNERNKKCKSIGTTYKIFNNEIPLETAVSIASNGINNFIIKEEKFEFINEINSKDDVESLIQTLAWCNPSLLSMDIIQSISNNFKDITVAAAASLVRVSENGELNNNNNNSIKTQNKHLSVLSLDNFFEKHALMPLVDFLHTVEVVARMKWRAQGCLKWLSNNNNNNNNKEELQEEEEEELQEYQNNNYYNNNFQSHVYYSTD